MEKDSFVSNIKILIGPSTFGAQDSAPVDKLTKNGFSIIKNPFGRKLKAKELAELLPGVQGLIAGLETLDRDIMKKSDLKIISRCGAGLSNVDLDTAKELGIKVVHTPDAPTNSVAELTVGMMINLIRHAAQMDRDLHNGLWSKRMGIQLGGSTVAIIGFGRIGRRIAQLLKPFNVKIVAVDPLCKGRVEGVPVVSLEDALSKSDIVTIHVSGDTQMIGRQEISLMKRGAFVLNCARGSVVDETALEVALSDGTLAGVWLDCFKDEPYAGALTSYPQALLTPHVGSYTAECRRRMETQAADNIISFFKEAI